MPIRLLGIVLLFILVSCSSKESRIAEAIDAESQVATERLDQLQEALNKGQLRNARILNEYANHLREKKPELETLIEQLATDATSKGPMFESLKQRLFDAKYSPQLFSDWSEQLGEIQLISEASSTAAFNDALSDPVNVLADMSEGELARVNAQSKSSELTSNQAKDYGAGSQLVGNPNYGQWVQGNGMSFWEWYGMYALLSDLTDRRRIRYSDWSRYRGYSYYNDWGRERYTSPTKKRAQTTIDTRTKKSFQSEGKRFTSPYAKRKTGGSQLSRKTKTTPITQQFSQRSTYGSRSSYSGSTRSGSSRTSRGLGRGK
ncbi:MAG: hypothetical protein AAGB12_04590 [Pseudomonadota bacterium]